MAVTGCSDFLSYYLFLWQSVTALIKDDGTSDGIVPHIRISACKGSRTVESYLHTCRKSHKAGAMCHCRSLPTWLASYPALQRGFEVRQT